MGTDIIVGDGKSKMVSEMGPESAGNKKVLSASSYPVKASAGFLAI